MASVFRSDTDPQLSADYTDDFFPQNAPHPPPGAPLLSDDDQQALSTFFKDMGSDSPAPGGPMHSESWMDLPPKFMGSTSFYGHQHDGFIQSLPGDFHQLLGSAPPSFTMPPPPPPSLPAAHEQSRASATSSPFDPYASMVLDSARPPPPPPPQPATARHSAIEQQHHQLSAEVLEAASVLQNGSLHRASFAYGTRPYPRQDAVRMLSSSAAATPRALNATLAHDVGLASALDMNPDQTSLGAAPTMRPAVNHNNPFTAMAILQDGSDQDLPPAAAGVHRSAPRAELHWGSDQSFNQVQYTPQSAKETTEALESMHLKTMECLEVSRSAATTRPSSPVYGADLNQLNLKTRTASMTAVMEASGRRSVPPPPPPPPQPQPQPRRKRRRGGASERDETGFGYNGSNGDIGADDEDGAVHGEFASRAGIKSEAAGAASRPGKKWGRVSVSGSNGKSSGNASHILPLSPNSPQQMAPSSSSSSGMGDGAGKRRRLGSQSQSQAKVPRENLSEEQKRENHIKSEQKRRTLIKEGFDDLCVLVPSLHGGGFSKSVMLSMAADWLEALISGNQQLREQL